VETPYVLIDLEKLQANIDAMAAFARRHGVKLRPHIKAHKLPQIARRQAAAGAEGITVAKLSEAEVFFAAGFADILVAYPLIGEDKMARVRALLAKGCKLSLLVDSEAGAQQLSRLAAAEEARVFVKVDSGLGRCGLPPGPKLERFVAWLCRLPRLNFRGLLTHAGHAYGCPDPGLVAQVGRKEGEMMVAAADSLRRQGIPVAEVSIGSTPTATWGGQVAGVTEVRPGNYVFYDAVQVALGVATPEQCSLKVVATVVSRPAPGRAIIDAGAKVLALDQGAHGSGAVRGYGLLEQPSWQLVRLSEEHGILEGTDLPNVGDRVSIIPNHACPVLNLAERVWTSTAEQWPVAARGRVW
jgi:D-serine deaminase-like pyridoxal phosphate-dependent protein